MSGRIYPFFLTLLALIVAAAFLLEPHSRSGGKTVRAAQVEFDRYHYYEILPEGVLRVVLADKGWHYSTHEEMENPIFIQRGQEHMEGLSGKKAIWQGDEVRVTGEVYYWHSEGYNLFTDHAVYNRTTEIIRGRGPFLFEWSGGEMTGRDFVANGAKATLQAKDIQAKLWPDRLQ